MNRGDHSICMKIEQGLQSDQVIIQLPCACTRVFTLRVSVCHLLINCSSAGSCECNPERRIHQYPRRQRNANRVYPMWRGERNILATIVGIVVARNTTRLDGVQLKPISDKVLQSRKTVQGPLLVPSPKQLKDMLIMYQLSLKDMLIMYHRKLSV